MDRWAGVEKTVLSRLMHLLHGCGVLALIRGFHSHHFLQCWQKAVSAGRRKKKEVSKSLNCRPNRPLPILQMRKSRPTVGQAPVGFLKCGN